MKAEKLLLCVVTVGLYACAGLPSSHGERNLLADALFEPPLALPDSKEVFALNEEMRAYVRAEILPRASRVGTRRALADALRADLSLDYDTTTTRTAAQAFNDRSGNCLSLVILAGALAQELGIPVAFQSVHAPGTWSRSDGIVFLNGHVNLAIGRRVSTSPGTIQFESPLVIDFAPPEVAARQRTRPISESTILAMFRNNRAAESLVEGKLIEAYWWVRGAVEMEPSFLPAYNTLGVLYMRRGALLEAGTALRYAHEREPGNAQVLANLVKLTALQGRPKESERYARMLAEIEKHPPFYFLDRGLEALAAGDADGARALLRRALAQMPHDHEVHFAIALADLQRGDIRAARQHLAQAVEGSPTPERRAIYGAKLDRLNAQRIN